jgi:alcohol dehydrogenase (cytochrome c)
MEKLATLASAAMIVLMGSGLAIAQATPSSPAAGAMSTPSTSTPPPSGAVTAPTPSQAAASSPSNAGPATPAPGTEPQPALVKNVTGATSSDEPAVKPGEWPRQARDYANTRYSPLKQITAANVSKLRVAWSFSNGIPFGQEGAPLVVGDTMYLVTPFPDIAYAIDLSKPGNPVKWSFDPNPSNIALGKACCDPVIRGWVYADGMLIYNLLDDHTIAVDAKTGKEVWRIKMGNVEDGGTMTMPPFVVGDKVFVGNSGGEMGKIGWMAALDVKTGKELWRAYSTGPDKLVKIGPDFKAPYAWMQGKDLGVKSWPADMWTHGGGAAWGWISYDPKLNLIYYGTSNPGPRVPAQRPGYNLWTSAVFARDADTGEAKWAYQFTPHDQWDYDGVNENVLIDLPFKGETRHVLVHFDRNGYAYTIDRATGEVLVAAPFAYQTWTSGFNYKTGMPDVVPKEQPLPDKTIDVCPPDIGGKDWEPAAFSKQTGLLYVGAFNLCMQVTDKKVTYVPGTPYDGMDMKRSAAPGGNWGEFIAWNPATGKVVWKIPENFMVMSGALATAGNLVFYGTVDGWFRAVNAATGKVLWSQKLSSGIIGDPITYTGPHGRQYVAVLSGVGGAAMVEKNQKGFPARGSTLYVFSIDGLSPSSGPGQLTTEGAGAPAIPTPSGHLGRP